MNAWLNRAYLSWEPDRSEAYSLLTIEITASAVYQSLKRRTSIAKLAVFIPVG